MVSLWGWRTCASLFSVYTTSGHHFPLKFPQFLRKIKVRQRPPGLLPLVRAGGANRFQLDVVYMVLTAFHTHSLHTSQHTKHPVEKQLSPGNSFTFCTPKIYRLTGRKNQFFQQPNIVDLETRNCEHHATP